MQELLGFDRVHWDRELSGNYDMALEQIWEVPNIQKIGYTSLLMDLKHSLRDISEVVKTKKAMWCCGKEIYDVGYIFPMSDLLSHRYPTLNGVQNVYFARYTENARGEYEDILPFEPFVSSLTYRYRLFSSIFLALKFEIDKIFFRVSKDQGGKKYFNVPLQHEVWKYIFAFLSNQTGVHVGESRESYIEMRQSEKNYCFKRSKHDLSMRKVRLRTKVETISIESSGGVTFIGRLLGSSSLVGVRKKFPRINEGNAASLSSGDTVNVLDFRPDVLAKDSLLLRYDYLSSRVSGRILYSNHPVTDSTLMEELGFPQFTRESTNEETNNNNQDLTGYLFSYNSRMFRVNSVLTGGRVRSSTVDDGDSISVDMSVDTANRFIDEFNDDM